VALTAVASRAEAYNSIGLCRSARQYVRTLGAEAQSIGHVPLKLHYCTDLSPLVLP